jgi:hypothetical protein
MDEIRRRRRRRRGLLVQKKRILLGGREKNDDLRMTLCKHIAVNFFFLFVVTKKDIFSPFHFWLE